MDNYTKMTKDWLDQRFRTIDEEGIYVAHQPIYGFRRGHSEQGILSRYIITFQIMKLLSHLKFTSLLDIGGAEGYTAAIVQHIFGVDVRSCDLSEEACYRAKEIFNIDGQQVDIHELPFQDNEFDVVLCSETLEHVPDLHQATIELIRVCKKAVIITVPHESKKVIEKNIRENIPHSHIHSLSLRSFNFSLSHASRVLSHRILSRFTRVSRLFVDAIERKEIMRYSGMVVSMYNFFIPVLRTIFGKRLSIILIYLDEILCSTIPLYDGMIFIILKNEDFYFDRQQKNVSARQIIEYSVPYHYLGSQA